MAALGALQAALLRAREEHADSVMPGFTHLQSAQPVTLGHHLMAYFEMIGARPLALRRRARAAEPVPAGLARRWPGTGFPIDRDATAAALGFDGPTAQLARCGLATATSRSII